MEAFCAQIWPEDEVPAEHRDCTDCGLHRHGSRMIWGEGNPRAPVMFVLDNPGAREDREGRSFVCGTRETLQRAAQEAGLNQNQLYITYLLKRRPRRAYEKDKARAICMKHLHCQLDFQKPSLVVLFGNVVVQSILQNPEQDVKGLRGNWLQVHGYTMTVSYHPLAARRRPNLFPYLLEDLQRVAQALNK